MQWHYETEIIAAVVLIILIIDAHRRLGTKRLRNKVFMLCLIFSLVSSIIDIIDSLIPLWSLNYWALMSSRTLYYIFSSIPAMIWFFYLAAIVYEDELKAFKFWVIFGCASFAIFIAFFVANFWTCHIFSFDAAGNTIHGPFYFLSFVFCGLYTLLFLGLLGFTAKKINNKAMIGDLILMPTIIWVGLTLELFSDTWLMLGPSYMVSLLSAYLFIQNQKNSHIIDKLSLEAATDNLTGLLNRTAFEKTLNNAIVSESGQEVALLIADIDGLKLINDTLGHPMGDEAIQTVATILKDSFKEAESVCRIGGDEFAIVIVNKSPEFVRSKTEECMSKFNGKFIGQGGLHLPLHCSIGISFKGSKPQTFSGIYHCADAALYFVKRGGKSSFAVYAPEMEAEYQKPLNQGL